LRVDEVSVGDIPAGSVVAYEGRRWLVLESCMGPPPFGFYPPWELILQPLPSGPHRTLRCTVARRLAVAPPEFRELRYMCRQYGELLLLEPASGEMVSLPDRRTRLDIDALEPGGVVRVAYHCGQPIWVTTHDKPPYDLG
jgi:translation elongation factor P/translation initiation factor 5A